MNFSELLDMKFKDVLEQYCTVFSPECCYYYGIFKTDDVDDLYANYNIEEYEEAFCPETLINMELLYDCEEVGDYVKLEHIMSNLGITKKIGDNK